MSENTLSPRSESAILQKITELYTRSYQRDNTMLPASAASIVRELRDCVGFDDSAVLKQLSALAADQ